MNDLIGITTGDHRGVGPEIIAKSIYKLRNKIPAHRFLLFGRREIYLPYKKLLPKDWIIYSGEHFNGSQSLCAPEPGALHFVEPGLTVNGKKQNGFLSGRYIELAVRAALEGRIAAIVTGPIDKSALNLGGYHYSGHTEMLQAICNEWSGKNKTATMMLVSKSLRVSLVTVHVSIANIARSLNKTGIMSCIENTVASLQDYFGILNPRIAVLALNPHAGDRGLFGTEESRIILPAIKAARIKLKKKSGLMIDGPFPADGFFAHWNGRYRKIYDAVICQYHDQGLIPVKLLDFKHSVNLTLGLPIIRTSVDHGIGLDIAGKNKADPSSLCAAIELAITLSKKVPYKPCF